MSSRLHNLVQSLLLGHAEEDPNPSLFGSPANFAQRTFGPIGEGHFYPTNLAHHSVLEDVPENAGVLSNALGRFKNRFDCHPFQRLNDSRQ